MATDWGTATAERTLEQRPRTRALLVYGLVNRLGGPAEPGAPLHTLFEFGRFAAHLRAGSALLPSVLVERPVAEPDLGLPDSPALPLTTLTVLVLITPRGDLTLALDVGLPEEADADLVADVLAATCFRREELNLAGEPLLEWARGALPAGELRPAALEFGRDVHQMVFPGGRLLGQVREEHGHELEISSALSTVIHRGPAQVASGIRMPEGLNEQGATLLAHRRGVSVAAAWGPRVAGWGAELENTLGVVVLLQVSALSVVQRTRRNAFRALSTNERAMLDSTDDARSLIADLSTELNDMQLDLSFGVEAYLDSVLIPETVLGGFQASLRDAVGLAEGLANTSRMLDRLQSVITARLSGLEAAMQEQVERRNRVFSGVVAIGTLIALPPALLLAFFGLNGTEVDQHTSMFDLGRYWPAYVLAWLPFIVLVLAGYVLQRRIRADARHLSDRGES